MNILFVFNTALIPTRGGTERVTISVANSLQEKGHIVYYMSTNAALEDKEKLQAPNYFFIDPCLEIEKRREIICDICRKHHIDIVINEWGARDNFDIFSKNVLPNVKIISCIHYDVFGLIKSQPRGRSTNPFKRRILDLLACFGIDLYRIKHLLTFREKYRKMLRVSDAVVVVSPVIAKELKLLTGIHPEKIVSILNPLPFDNIQPFYNASTKEKMFLFVGRLSPEKNVDILLKAWAKISHQHPDWKLEIAGDGILRNNLIQLVEVMNIPRVHFHGHVENVNTLYNRAEYLVLPSSHESFSCVVLESMAYGCHPIVFDYPSAPVVIPNARLGTRIKHSTRALAKAMSTAIKNNTSNRYNIDEISKHLASFDINKIILEWQSLFNKITSSHTYE